MSVPTMAVQVNERLAGYAGPFYPHNISLLNILYAALPTLCGNSLEAICRNLEGFVGIERLNTIGAEGIYTWFWGTKFEFPDRKFVVMFPWLNNTEMYPRSIAVYIDGVGSTPSMDKLTNQLVSEFFARLLDSLRVKLENDKKAIATELTIILFDYYVGPEAV